MGVNVEGMMGEGRREAVARDVRRVEDAMLCLPMGSLVVWLFE